MTQEGKGVFVYRLTDYQIGGISVYFRYADAPPPNNIKIKNIGLVDGGDVIIEFIQYGHLRTEKIPREPNQ